MEGPAEGPGREVSHSQPCRTNGPGRIDSNFCRGDRPRRAMQSPSLTTTTPNTARWLWWFGVVWPASNEGLCGGSSLAALVSVR